MYEKILEEICALERKCGDVLKNADRSNVGEESKGGHGNLVTKYDRLVQDMLQEGLKEIMPEAVFYGEEEDIHQDISTGYAFIVDPIDGTTNFIMDANYSAISIGLVKNLERVVGAVYNPYTDEMFTAIKGQGAFLNGKPIHVSNRDLKDSISIFGTAPYYEEFGDSVFKLASAYYYASLDIRRLGTASLDLCMVAAGKAAIYFEQRLSPWDFAAGSLIVEEAGGITCDFNGDPLVVNTKTSVIGMNKESSMLKEYFK